MSAISITRGSFSQLARELADAIPLGLRRALRGPVIVLKVDEREAFLSPRRLRGRPVILEVSTLLVLRKRLTIPAAGQRDLPFAAKLLIEAETPFAADEVLADVSLVKSLPETGELAFEVRLIPREKIIRALAQFRLKPRQVSGIVVSEDPRPFGLAGLATSRRPFLRAHLGWLVPSAIVLTALGAWAYFESESRRGVVASLEHQVAAELASLRAKRNALDERNAGDEREAAVREAFGSAPSAFVLLHALRANLPAGTFVNRVQMQSGEFRFSVATPDALNDVRTLQQGLAEYDVRIEGSVVDMPDGLQATIFLVTSRVQL